MTGVLAAALRRDRMRTASSHPYAKEPGRVSAGLFWFA
jgi:hypothetical protein